MAQLRLSFTLPPPVLRAAGPSYGSTQKSSHLFIKSLRAISPSRFSSSPPLSKKVPSSSQSAPQPSLSSSKSKPKPLQNPPRPTLSDSDIQTAFLKGSGPGGQKINKTASAVQLTHLPTGVVVKCQETRSQTQNAKIARRILAEKVDRELNGEESWERQKEMREGEKKRRADKKKRRKYRRLLGDIVKGMKAAEKEGKIVDPEDKDVEEIDSEGVGEGLIEEKEDEENLEVGSDGDDKTPANSKPESQRVRS